MKTLDIFSNKKFQVLNLIIAWIIIILMISSCRSTKKMTESTSVTSDKTEVVQKSDVKEEVKVNNDKTTYRKTTITETEYLTPEKPTNKPTEELKDESGLTEQQKPESVVKSTKVTIIEEGTKDNTVVETKKTDNSEIATKTEDQSKVENSTVEKKSVPIPWWLIFGMLALVFVTFVYFSKSGFGLVVKTFIKKLFV